MSEPFIFPTTLAACPEPQYFLFHVLKAVSRKLFCILAILASRFSNPLRKSSSSPDKSGDTSQLFSSSSKFSTSNAPCSNESMPSKFAKDSSVILYSAPSFSSVSGRESRLLVKAGEGSGCDINLSANRKRFLLCDTGRWFGVLRVKVSSLRSIVWGLLRLNNLGEVVLLLLPVISDLASAEDSPKVVGCPLYITNKNKASAILQRKFQIVQKIFLRCHSDKLSRYDINGVTGLARS